MFFRHKLAATAVILAASLCGIAARAQSRGVRGGPSPGGARFAGRGLEGRRFERSDRRVFYPGWGWGYFPFPYPDTEVVNYPPPPEPPVVLDQPVPQAPPVDPLLMELRNGQWVRVIDGGQLPPTQAQASSKAGPTQGATAPTPLPPAMIVFRDGHSEEVQKYMIEGDLLYLSADYWNTGTWVRKIPISELDVPATLTLNQQRGSQFNLPSGPGQVMLRF